MLQIIYAVPPLVQIPGSATGYESKFRVSHSTINHLLKEIT